MEISPNCVKSKNYSKKSNTCISIARIGMANFIPEISVFFSTETKKNGCSADYNHHLCSDLPCRLLEHMYM